MNKSIISSVILATMLGCSNEPSTENSESERYIKPIDKTILTEVEKNRVIWVINDIITSKDILIEGYTSCNILLQGSQKKQSAQAQLVCDGKPVLKIEEHVENVENYIGGILNTGVIDWIIIDKKSCFRLMNIESDERGNQINETASKDCENNTI